MTAADRLNEIEARANAATEGPWSIPAWHDFSVMPSDWAEDEAPIEERGTFAHISTTSAEDTEFIAHARTDVPALVAALRAVLQLHRTGPGDQDWCVDCGETSPCQTVRAIEEALNA